MDDLRQSDADFQSVGTRGRLWNVGKVTTHKQLLKEVWGPDSVHETHYLRVYMAQLRRKIEADSAQPRFILTEPGVGYRLASQ